MREIIEIREWISTKPNGGHSLTQVESSDFEVVHCKGTQHCELRKFSCFDQRNSHVLKRDRVWGDVLAYARMAATHFGCDIVHKAWRAVQVTETKWVEEKTKPLD
jgi:hypothetical protein